MNKKLDTIITVFFTERYDYLLECSYNILKRLNKVHLNAELVTECFMHIKENQIKLEKQLLNGKIEAIAVQWMNYQVIWNNTKFKKNFIYADKLLSFDVDRGWGDTENTDNYDDYDKYERFNLLDDTIDDEELLQQEKERSDKLNTIAHNLSKMTLDQKMLYDKVFNQDINTSGKLAKHTGLARTGCHYLITNLKRNLRTGYITE